MKITFNNRSTYWCGQDLNLDFAGFACGNLISAVRRFYSVVKYLTQRVQGFSIEWKLRCVLCKDYIPAPLLMSTFFITLDTKSSSSGATKPQF